MGWPRFEFSLWSAFDWWIRVGDYGLSVIDHRKHRPLFSERNGLMRPRPLHVGPICIRLLTPKKPSRPALRVVGGE